LETVARKIDRYSGAAGDIRPAVGVVAVPIRLLVELRDALNSESNSPETT